MKKINPNAHMVTPNKVKDLNNVLNFIFKSILNVML